tara:strand:- start:800 stop:1045 length:246 start_codon:yes stop_codon:yes gene_type:complete
MGMKRENNIEGPQELLYDRSSGEPYEVIAKKLWNGIDHFVLKCKRHGNEVTLSRTGVSMRFSKTADVNLSNRWLMIKDKIR